MKALVLHGAGDLRVEEHPGLPDEPDEMRLQVAIAGLCGSDMQVIASGRASVPLPLVLGHEFGATDAHGRFYTINPMLGCGECAWCARGDTHICPQRRVLGFRRPGGFAQEVVVPARNAVAAEGLSAVQAALVEPLANGVHAWHRAGRPDGPVAIVGCGSLGICLLHVLRSRGLEDITVVDPVPSRLSHAEAAGAGRVATRLEGRFEAVFDCAGTATTRQSALDCTLPGGSVALVGLHDDTLAVSASAVVVGDRTLAGCFAYSEPEFREAVGLAATLDTPWAERIDFAGAPQAVRDLLAGKAPAGRIKTLFQFVH
ncbi:threonine dehydrogenase-like Zn-dependent dehydrogenase [Pseudacidovorax sp. 1753]|uniref:zinc-dependent alcohol dehydrogenase n=1 Tax=Pseudacidovorax sp. 1753 TaxID=3156419 RepID=UPI003395E625